MKFLYDYLVVGAGLFGAVFAHEATVRGKKCLVIEKRKHVAGAAYTQEINGIQVHCYGAHIFHTNNKEVLNRTGRRFIIDAGNSLHFLPHCFCV